MKQVYMVLTISLMLFSCTPQQTEIQEEAVSPEQNSNVVEMGLEAQRHIGLEVAPTSLTQLTEYLHVTGTVQPIDSKIAHVRPLARGRIQEVLAKVGDRVQIGQSLAQLDNIEAGEIATQYEAAQSELQKLKIQQANSARQLERSQRLVEIGATSQKDFELAQAEHNAMLEGIRAHESLLAGLRSKLQRFGLAEADLQGSSITSIPSPLTGIVISMQAAPGEVVDPGMELFSIADISEVWVQAEVYEKDLGRIRIGQSTFISVDTYPDQRFSGKVAYISDALDPKTRTAKVRCEVTNQDLRLKLDMFVSVDLPTTFSQRAVAVPIAAIQQVDDRKVVFVRGAETKFEARTIQAGREVDGKVEVISGLQEGEPVVVDGAFHLKAILAGGTFGEEE